MADTEKKFPSPEEETEMAFEEETPLPLSQEGGLTETFAESELEEELTPVPETGLNLASLRDRAAAGLFDLLILGYLYVGSLFVYNYIVWREFLRPIPSKGMHGILFHSLFALLAFLYFFIFEGVFFTSLGKFLSNLSVRDALGRPASLFAIALRNILRPVDYLLAIFPTWLLLEKLEKRQRLGDLAAGTVVMKHYARLPTRLAVAGHTASGSLRLIAGTFDLVFSSLWIAGILLWIDYQRPFLSLLVLFSLPLFYLLWHLLWEVLFQTTFGLWIFGLRIVTEDGSPIRFPQAFLRAFFRLFDTNPIGWTFPFLSQKNQRPSDLAAGTVVVHAQRAWSAMIGMGVSLALIGGSFFLGFANPHNYLTPFFKIDFLSRVFSIRVGGLQSLPQETKKGLFVKGLTFLEENRTTPRANDVFKAGERILFAFDITGFTVRDNEVWIQEDLTTRYPDYSIGFKQENIVDFHQHLKDPEQPIQIINTLVLPADAKPGHYTLAIVLHDRLSDRHLTEQRTFMVEP